MSSDLYYALANHFSFPRGDLRHSVEPNEGHARLGSIISPEGSTGMSVYLTPLLLFVSVTVEAKNQHKLDGCQITNYKHIFLSLKTFTDISTNIYQTSGVYQALIDGGNTLRNTAHTGVATQVLSRFKKVLFFCLLFQKTLGRLSKRRAWSSFPIKFALS